MDYGYACHVTNLHFIPSCLELNDKQWKSKGQVAGHERNARETRTILKSLSVSQSRNWQNKVLSRAAREECEGETDELFNIEITICLTATQRAKTILELVLACAARKTKAQQERQTNYLILKS